MKTLRKHRELLGWFMTCLMAVWLPGPATHGATLYWDAGTDGDAVFGGTGTWNLTNTFWDPSGTDLVTIDNVAWSNGANIGVFGGIAGTITLGSAISAGGLVFNSGGYTLTPAASELLTLVASSGVNSPVISVNNNGFGTNSATISAALGGTSGLTKSGNGALRLFADNSTTLSGDISIKAGTLVIADSKALGSGTAAVSVTGIAQTGNPGYSGGALLVLGNQSSASGAGISLNREVSVSGRGPGASNATGGLISVGYNNFAGGITLASGATEARAFASHGATTISGGLYLGSGAAQILYGDGNWIVSSQVSGVELATDRFIKSGNSVSTTLWLQNTANNYTQTLRIDSGTVRAQANSVLGLNMSAQSVDLNNGTLEVRTDAPSGFATRNIAFRDNATGTLFVDHDITGSLSIGSGLYNQTVTFNNLQRLTGTGGTATLNVNGRNGYNTTFNTLFAAASNQSTTLTNNSSGLVTLPGTINIGTNTTARTFTIQGGGDWLATGTVAGSGAAHAFTKGGSGTLTMTSAAGNVSTFTGNANVNDGTLKISSIDVLNNTSSGAGRVVFGGGALSFVGASGTGAGEVWTNKTLDMNSANSYLLASQSGSAPTALVLPNNIGATSTAAKTLNLGGSASSGVINQITGLISNTVNLTNVLKFGTGTWEVQAPGNYGTSGTLTITAIGATASTTLTLSSGTTAGLAVGQPISGTGIPAGAKIVQIPSSTTIIISAGAASTGTSATVGLASGSTSTFATTAVSTGTTNPVVTVASTANLVPGQKVISTNLPATGNWYIRDITSATTITLVSATGASITAGAVLLGEVITPQTSTNFGGNLTISNGIFRATATSASSDIINATSNVIFNTDSVTLMGNAGGTFNYVGWSGGSSTEVLGRLTATAGHGLVSITNGTGADTLSFIDLTRTASATLDFQPGTGSIGFSTAPTLTNGVLPGYATFNGVDFVTLSSGNVAQYSGATAWVGALAPTSTVNYSIGGAASTTGAGSVNSLKLTGGAALTLGGALGFTTNPGGLLFDNTSGVASITGAFAIGTAAQELVITTNGGSPAVVPAAGAALVTGNALTLGSALSNTTISSGAGSLTKAGTGTLILFGNNVYTGNTTINQGAIQMSGTTAALGGLGTAANQTAIRQGAVLDVNGAGPSTAIYTGGPSYPQISIGALTGTGIITNSGAGGTAQSSISLGGTAQTGTTTFGGTLQDGTGVLNVIINGTSARSQAIIGDQPYTGVTVINTGNLVVTKLADGGIASGLGASTNAASNLVFNAGTLVYTGSVAAGAQGGGGVYQTEQTPTVSTDRLFTLAGNATILSNGTYGNEAAAAGTGANSAALIFRNTGDVAFGTSGAKTLTLGGTSIGDNQFRPRLTDNTVGGAATALTVSGGLWILNPLVANTYSGTTTISGGQLRAILGVGIPGDSLITLSGGVLEVPGTSFTRTLGSAAGNVQLTGGNTGFAAGSTDRLVVTLGGGALTWGGATFNPAQLVLGSSTALGETEFSNAINLGTATRTITVNNNGNTGVMVTAGIVSGVLSGSAGGNLQKAGNGALILGDANTYVGNTQLQAGSIVVTSIGALNAAASSFGTNVGGGNLQLGNATTGTGTIIYVGPGETTTRTIQINTTTGSPTIASNGSGALVLASVSNNIGGAKTLNIRGSNTDNNMITSTLADNGGALAVTKTDGGTWILNPSSANSFTGAITVSQGNLGLTSNGVGTAASITVNNGSIFAYGGALVTSSVFQGNNSTAVFSGQNDITIDRPGVTAVQKTAGNNQWTLSNNLEGGALLTINGNFTNLEAGTTAATQTISIRGFGSTVWNGAITENAAAGGKIAWSIALANDAYFQFDGSAANTYTSTTTLSQGTLILSKNSGVAQFGSSSAFNFNGGVLKADLPLTGSDAIATPVVLGGDPAAITATNSGDAVTISGTVTNSGGNRNLLNNLDGGAALTLSGNVNLSNDSTARTLTIRGTGDTIISGVVANGGTGAGGLAFSGLSGSLTLTNGTNSATGALTVNRNTVTLSGSGVWAGSIVLNPTGTLTLDNSAGSVNRLADAGAVTGQGGILNFIGNNTGGTSETTGVLTLNSVQTYITMNTPASGPNSLTFASVAFANTGSSLNLNGVSGLGSANKVLFTTAPTDPALVVNTVIPRIFIGGGDFARYDTTNGVVAFASYNPTSTTNINLALSNDTVEVNAGMTMSSITAHKTVNALKINGSGLTVGGSGASLLTLSSAGLINTGGDNSLNVAGLQLSKSSATTGASGQAVLTPTGGTVGYGVGQAVTGTGVPAGTYITAVTPMTITLSANLTAANPTITVGTTGFFQVAPGTTLTVNGSILGLSGLSKALTGTLNFTSRQFYTSTTNLLNGTTKLGGGLNTLFPNQILNINDGATLDLVGSAQYVGQLSDPGTMPGAGGIITTSTGTATFVTNLTASALFSGEITGSVNFGRLNGNTLTINSLQDYTGATYLLGGTTTLESDGQITSSSSIEVNAATLLLSNNSGLQYQNNDRIGDAIPINLRDGTLSVTGRISTAATETLGAVTSAQGANTITATATAGTIYSLDLTLASLTRNVGTTLNFTGTTLGQAGNSARIMVAAPLAAVAGGALGGWAIANSTDYAAYNTGNGIGIVGQGGYAGYDSAFGSGNITLVAAPLNASGTTLLSGGATTGLLKLDTSSFNNIAFGGSSDVLHLEQGGILRANVSFGASIGTPSTRGVITSGSGELVIFNNGSANPTYGSAAVTSGSPVVTGLTTTGLQPGMTVTNANFPVGTKVVSVDSQNQVTLSSNATATATGQTLTIGSLDGGSTTNGSAVVTMASTLGVSPGMTLTGTGVPTGTYVVSVDSPTQLTLSQNSTATASGTITFTAGFSNVVLNSVVQGATSLVKSGAGVLAVSANNTHTGGTVVVQGTLNLVGNGVVIPAGGLVIGGATLTMLTNPGQIDPSNVVTIRRSSTLTLVGNNTLDSFIFDNNGGTTNPTVNVGGVLTLTNPTPVTVNNLNALTVPTITGGTLALGSGARTISVQGPTIAGDLYSMINPALNIASAITGTGPINKTGNGLLQLSGASTFYGLNVAAGGIVVGASSTNSAGTVVSGPLGTGPLAMAAGTTIYSNSSASVANPVSFAGTPTFDSVANTVWTNTFTGVLSGAGVTGPSITVNVINPFLTVALLGTFPGSFSSITKTGLGTLIFNATNYTGNFDATALGNPYAVSLIHDGDGTGSVQTLSMGSVAFDTGIVPTITINRGGSLPFPTASNKILSPSSVSNVGLGLTVNVNAGYGLKVSEAVAFSGTPTYNVSGTQASNVTQGLYLSGDLTGTGFNKTNSGTLVINNATPVNNTFIGNINITQGTVSVNTDAQLGDAANLVVLNPSTGTSAFRATDNITTGRVFQLANTANTRAFEVSNGKILQLTSAFDLNAGAGTTASLNKQDLGTLFINASNASWNGALNITQGVVRIASSTALGTSTINVSPAAAVVGAALQLTGGINVANTINMQGTNNLFLGGINSGGQLQSVSGSNTYSGTINIAFDAAFGADSGSTLNIAGPVVVTGSRRVGFLAEGDINISSGATFANAMFGIDKFGAGTLTISVPIAGAISGTGGFKVEKGMVVLNGTATTNSSGAVNLVYQGATLRLDNSGTNTNNRLTARALTLQGGTFDFVSNNSTETAGAFIADQGANTINLGGTGTAALTFASFAGSAGGTLNVTGTFGTSTNFLKFTAAPALTPVTTGILNRVTVNGSELASYSASLGVVAFTGYSLATNILSATATQTFKATTSTLNSLTGNQTLNALTLNNTAAVGGLGGNPPASLTLTSGTILANGSGGAYLNVPIVTLGTEGIIHVQSGQSLTVNSGMSGTAGLSKNLAGMLNINAQQFVSGTHYVNGGTLKLTTTTATNTLLFNQAMAVNAGGTFDLNGNNQFIAGLSSASAGGSSGIGGGSVTNSDVSNQSTFVINGNTNFGGVISGNIYLNKTGTGALNLQQPQTYSGPTLLTGGTTTLNDNGALPNNSQPIGINFATLSLANGNLYAVSDRVSDTAPITLKGGGVTVAGRVQYASTETLGAITLADAFNAIITSTGGTNVNSLDVTAASLTRTGATATVRFNATGQLGSSARLTFASAPTLSNNILGPWAIVDREYASYDSTYGIGALNGNGFAGYSQVTLFGGPTASDNVRFNNAGTTTLLGNVTANTLTFGQQTTATTLNLGGFMLSASGILFGQATDNVDFSIISGSIAAPAGGGDLYLTHANFGGTNRTVTLGAPIVDNGGATRVIYTSGQVEAAGVGNTTLSGVSTNTGGTILNSGNVVIGATGGLGTGGITVNQAILTQTAGGVIPATNVLTMGGSSTVTLTGNNTLAGIGFNNMGGAAPTVTPTGTLTLTGGINVTTINAGGVATIGAGTLDLNAAGSYSINVGATIINGVDMAPWQAGLNISSLIQNGGIVKTGNGMLQLSSTLSTFAGGISVNAGGLVIGASSVGPNLGDTLVSGPLGVGTVTMAANTTLVSTGNFSVTNDFVFLGNTVFNGTQNLTLNGNTTLPSIWNVTVTAPQMTLTIGNVRGSLSTDEVNKSGLGTLILGNYNGTINIAGGLLVLADGNGLGTSENVVLGSTINLTADTAITVNRSGGAPNARNKNVQQGSMSNNGSIMAVNNQNGYGLDFTGTISLTGASHFSVANATASNLVPGLTLSGVVSDTGGFSLVKSGAGTLALTNSGNTFGGSGATIDVLNGILAASSNGALGNLANSITLGVDGTTGTGFRAIGSFSTARTFNLNALNNAFEVTTGNLLTLTTPFTLSAASNTLFKNDNGSLAINADNTGWTGAVGINAGALVAMNNNALGSGTITVASASGAALQLSGGVTLSNPFTIGASTSNGINSGGVIQSISGNNIYSGLITQTSGAAITFGADAGATLDLTGGVNSPGANSITFAGAGNINLTTAGINNGSSFNKIGDGTLTIKVANPSAAAAQTINLFDGITVFSGAGTLGPVGTATGAVTVDVGSTLTLDNTNAAGGNVNNRLGTTRPITFRGGSFNLIGNESTTTTETFVAPTLSRGLTIITVTAQTNAGANLLFTGSSTVPANAQNSTTATPTGVSILFRGTQLGTAAGNGVATIRNSATTNGFAFNGQNGATGTKNKGIMPFALIDTTATGNGISFATGDSGGTTNAGTIAILRPLAANEYETANTVVANNNILLNGGATTNVATGLTVNSFTIDASANLTLGNGVLVSLSSGGILVREASGSSISGGVLNQTSGFAPLNIWTVGDLTISSTINGGNGTANGNVGFVKAGAGTLTLSPALSTIPGLTAIGVNSMSGQLVINQGTLMLNGGKNTIQANNFLALNGGTLDLNGNSQQILSLFTDGVVDGAGGIITSGNGMANFVINQDNVARNFAGSIQGDVKVTRSGQNTWTLYSNQTYTGSTLLNSATTTLRDAAALSGTVSLDINYATLNLDNNAGTIDMADRLKDDAAITLRGGTLSFQGRVQTASTESVGVVTLAQANSFINSTVGGTGINSADLMLAGLNRTVGGGTVNFTAATGGLIGNSARILTPTINGVSTDTAGGGLTNNIIGGWAIIGTSDFASYIPGLGIGALNQVGFPQYTNATSTTTTLNTAGVNDNISINTAVTGSVLVSNDTTINSLRMGNVATNTVAIAAGKTLTLSSGGLLFFSTASQIVGSAANVGSLTTTGPELFVYAQGTGPQIINSVITGSGVALVKSGAGAVTLNGTNTYGGGTTVNQGTLTVASTGYIPLATNPANGLVINGATVTLNAAGLIDPGNIVTTNGSSTLNLYGNTTIAGLVMNNNGGTANPSILTYSILANAGGPNSGTSGVLTIGASGIVATSSNVGTTSNIFGRVDFGTSANTVNVDSINANGTNDIAPLQAALALQGVVGSSGGITKLGNGVVTLNAQQVFTGALTVSAGGVRIGVTNGGSRFSALVLNSGTRLDLANASTTLGSLAGSGTVFASSGTPTLTVGFDNTSTIFSGALSRFNDATPNGIALTKVGNGTLTMTSAQSSASGSSGTITVNGGGLTYSGAGKLFPSVPTATAPTSAVTVNVNTGGTLTLDNSTASGGSLNNRLGMNSAAGTVNLQGGTLIITGNDSATTSETVNSIVFANGGGVLTLLANPASQLNVTITTLGALNATGGGLIRGINGTVAAPGNATLAIGTNTLQGGQGGGANGSTNMSIRVDILADASVTGLGTGFLVRDTATNLYRALAASELNTVIASWATAQNAGITGTAQVLNANRSANSLTVSGTGSLSSALNTAAFGGFGPGGGLLTLTLNTSGLLVLDGGAFTSNIGSLNGTAANTLTFHAVGSAEISLNGALGIGNTGGLVKDDAGTLSLNGKAYYTGSTTVNNGTLNLGSGSANTLAVVPGATTPTVTALALNGTASVVDLKGQNQAVGALSSLNPMPGMGGTVTSSTAAVLTSTGGGTFAGQITGSVTFTRAGNNTTLLTNANTYTGSTIIRGGILQLRDSGSILNSSSVSLQYGTLNIDNSGLSSLANLNIARVAATTPVTMQGGVLSLTGGGSIDTTATLNSVTVTGGGNTINILPLVNQGSTAALTIGNLVRAENHSMVNFNGFTSNTSTIGGQGLSVSGNIFLNQVNGATGPVNLTIAGAVTTAGSNIVTVPSTAGLVVGVPVSGTGLPANQFITGILDATRFTITTGTGVTAQASTTITAKNLTNNLIGGWAVADGSTFATYVTGFGVSVMGQTTQNTVAPAFDGTDVSAATTATQNISDSTASRTLASGARVANSWRLVPGAAQTITMSSGATVSLGVGIITNANFAMTIQGTDATNSLTGTGTDLYIYTNQNTTNINTKITGSIALVKSGGATLALGSSTAAANNDYTGGTYVQAGTLNLNGAAGSIIIPGNLTINNAAVTMNTNAGQIATTSNIIINGGGSFTLPNYSTGPTQTLSSITFDNQGGTGNPTFSFGTPTVATSTVILTAANAITSNNDSLATTPVISTGAATLTALQLSNAAPVISTSGLSTNGLNISVIINSAGGAISKMGSGSLTLSGANTFTTGFNLNEGTLIFGSATTGTVTNGPVGTGTLTIAGGTTIMSDGTLRTIANATVINGDFTVGGVVSGNGVTLSGAMNLGSSGRTITVTSPAVTATISGPVTSTVASGNALTKDGSGTLILSSAANNLNGGGVAITGGVLKNGVNNALPVATAVAISAGAGYDLNNFDQTVDRISGTGFVTQSGASTKTLTVSSTVNNSTFAGSLSDNNPGNASSRLALTKSGAGTTLTLSGVNNYTGVTTVNAGMLQFARQSALYNNTSASWTAANINVKSGATLAFNVGGTGEFTTGDVTTLLTNLAASSSATNGMNAGAVIGFDTTSAAGGSFTVSDVIADTTGASGGARGLTKLGAGTLALTGANTHTGATTVSGGTLQVGDATTGSLNGTGNVSVVAAGPIVGAPVLSGGSGGNVGVGVIAGSTIIGDAGNSANAGVIAPGIGNSATSNQTLTFTAAGVALTVASGSQMQLSITTPTSAADAGILAALMGGTYIDAANYATNNSPSWTTGAPAAVGNHDFINGTSGTLSLGTRLNGTFGNGTVAILDNGYLTGAQQGDVFNLLDWSAVVGTFTAGTGFTNGGVQGDFDLPTLSSGLFWDTSAFQTYGVLVVVPEPSRMLLAMFGLLGLFFCRRRRAL